MKCCVITFPGSNCDHDAIYVAELAGFQVVNAWHEDRILPTDTDLIVIPGGFSYGDYLRCGAIARFSPIMQEVVRLANRGVFVIGICNGFQILTEVGLLPGALLRNNCLTFKCCDVFLHVENNNTAFTYCYHQKPVIKIPIAHNEGNYYAPQSVISELEDKNRIIFRYCSEEGEVSKYFNPNGSINNIAGIINNNGNVLGMMPHPERYSEQLLGNDEGKYIFESVGKPLVTR